MVRGMATRTTSNGNCTIISPFRLNITTIVNNREINVIGLILGMKLVSYHRRLLTLSITNRVSMPAGLIGLDGVDDPGLAQGLLQQILLLVGERLVLNRPRHVHGGLDGARLVVGAVRVVGLGEVPTVEGGCRVR